MAGPEPPVQTNRPCFKNSFFPHQTPAHANKGETMTMAFQSTLQLVNRGTRTKELLATLSMKVIPIINDEQVHE